MARSFTRTNNDKVVYPHLSALDGATNVTISLWFYYVSYGNYDVLLSQHSPDGTNNGLALYLGGGTSFGCSFKNYSSNSFDTFNSVFTANKWHHILVNYDGTRAAASRVQLRINGVLKTRNAGTNAADVLATTTAPFALGCISADGTLPLTGRIADVAVWTNVTLTTEERLSLTAGRPTQYIRPANQIFRDRLAEDVAPQNAITSEAGVVTGTPSITDPYDLQVSATALAGDVWANSERTLFQPTTTARVFDADLLQYLSTTSQPGMPTSVPVTLVTWFKVDDVDTSYELLSIADSGSSTNYFGLEARGTDTGNPLGAVSRSNGGRWQATSGSIVAGQWHHGAAVFASPTSRTAYLDGVPGGASTASDVPVSLSKVGIGYLARSGGGDSHLNGALYGTAIYTAALTASEIARLASGEHPTQVRPESLWDYWNLDATGDSRGSIRSTILTSSGGGSLTSGPSVALAQPARTFNSQSLQYLSAPVTGLGINANDPITIVTRSRRNSLLDNVTFASLNYGTGRGDSLRLWAVSDTLYASAIDAAFTQGNSSMSYAGTGWKVLAAQFAATYRRVAMDGIWSTPSTSPITLTNAPTLLYVGIAALTDTSYPLEGDQSEVMLLGGLVSDAVMMQIVAGLPMGDIPSLIEGWHINSTGNITGLNGTVLTAVNGGTLTEGPATARQVRPRGIASAVWTSTDRTLTSGGGSGSPVVGLGELTSTDFVALVLGAALRSSATGLLSGVGLAVSRSGAIGRSVALGGLSDVDFPHGRRGASTRLTVLGSLPSASLTGIRSATAVRTSPLGALIDVDLDVMRLAMATRATGLGILSGIDRTVSRMGLAQRLTSLGVLSDTDLAVLRSAIAVRTSPLGGVSDIDFLVGAGSRNSRLATLGLIYSSSFPAVGRGTAVRSAAIGVLSTQMLPVQRSAGAVRIASLGVLTDVEWETLRSGQSLIAVDALGQVVVIDFPSWAGRREPMARVSVLGVSGAFHVDVTSDTPSAFATGRPARSLQGSAGQAAIVTGSRGSAQVSFVQDEDAPE